MQKKIPLYLCEEMTVNEQFPKAAWHSKDESPLVTIERSLLSNTPAGTIKWYEFVKNKRLQAAYTHVHA